MDLNKLTTSDKMILGGGIAYLIFMFFPWFGSTSASASAATAAAAGTTSSAASCPDPDRW